MPLAVTLSVSILLGFLTGLGIGGGSLLILWLTLILAMPQDAARGINLLFFLPSAVIACLFRKKQGKLDLHKMLPAMIAGAVGAAIFTFIGANLDTQALQKPFGFLLLVTGLREVFYRQRKAR